MLPQAGLSAQEQKAAGLQPQAWLSSNNLSYDGMTGRYTTRTQGTDTWSYGYDDLGRLTSAAHSGTGSGLGSSFTYDPAGNLTQVATTNPTTSTTYTPGVDNQVASVSNSGSTTPCALNKSGGPAAGQDGGRRRAKRISGTAQTAPVYA